MDETGFQMGIGQGQKVITRYRKKPAPLASSSTQESVTLIESVNGDSHAVMYATTGWKGSYGNYVVGTSDTGYFNDQLSME